MQVWPFPDGPLRPTGRAGLDPKDPAGISGLTSKQVPLSFRRGICGYSIRNEIYSRRRYPLRSRIYQDSLTLSQNDRKRNRFQTISNRGNCLGATMQSTAAGGWWLFKTMRFGYFLPNLREQIPDNSYIGSSKHSFCHRPSLILQLPQIHRSVSWLLARNG